MKYLEGTFVITPMSEMAADILSALLGDIGFETFVTEEEGLKAYVQQDLYDEMATQDVVSTFPLEEVKVDFSMMEAEDKNWNETWEATGFKPIEIGDRLLVCAPNADGKTEKFERVLYIEPRQAFGSGTHATTQMLLSRLLDMNLEGCTVVDAGCGTGILGLLCLKLGANHVLGYDIDEWSVENTLHNAELNGITNITAVKSDATVLEQNLLSEQTLKDELTTSVTAKNGNASAVLPCNLLLANINRNILMGDMPRFGKAVAPQGTLLLSGFLEEDVPLLVECAKGEGFSLLHKYESGEWRMLEFMKGEH